MPIPEIFLRPVHICPADARAADAARLLREHRVGALPVVDGQGRAIGIVTDRDLALRVVGARLDPSSTAVRDCMSSPLVTLHPSESTADAARKMRERLVRRLPIVDDEHRLLGIVTADDLIESLGSTLGLLAAAPAQAQGQEGRGPGPEPSIFGKE